MRRWIPLLVVGALALATACNSDGVTTGGEGSPTATETGATPTPTTTGDAWSLTVAAPTSQTCPVIMIQETFDANLVDIDTTGTSFIPEWNLTGDEVSVQPNGTVTGTTFSANWTTCEYNGSETFKRVWTWTGTLNAGETAFTGSKALEVITYANGDQTGSATLCNAVATPTGDACNNPGLTWTLSGTKN